MASDDRDFQILRVLYIEDMSHECGRTNNIQCCHAENPGGIKHALGFEHFDGYWNCAVDGVGDDAHECFGAVRGDSGAQVGNHAGIGLEQI